MVKQKNMGLKKNEVLLNIPAGPHIKFFFFISGGYCYWVLKKNLTL
jgi:hypothetical protein